MKGGGGRRWAREQNDRPPFQPGAGPHCPQAIGSSLAPCRPPAPPPTCSMRMKFGCRNSTRRMYVVIRRFLGSRRTSLSRRCWLRPEMPFLGGRGWGWVGGGGRGFGRPSADGVLGVMRSKAGWLGLGTGGWMVAIPQPRPPPRRARHLAGRAAGDEVHVAGLRDGLVQPQLRHKLDDGGPGGDGWERAAVDAGRRAVGRSGPLAAARARASRCPACPVHPAPKRWRPSRVACVLAELVGGRPRGPRAAVAPHQQLQPALQTAKAGGGVRGVSC
jgi:hypothetical protein